MVSVCVCVARNHTCTSRHNFFLCWNNRETQKTRRENYMFCVCLIFDIVYHLYLCSLTLLFLLYLCNFLYLFWEYILTQSVGCSSLSIIHHDIKEININNTQQSFYRKRYNSVSLMWWCWNWMLEWFTKIQN